VAIVVSGQVILKPSAAHADVQTVPVSLLKMVSRDLVTFGTVVRGDDRVGESDEHLIAVQGIGRGRFDHCVEIDPFTENVNGRAVHVAPCALQPIRFPWWQWGFKFEPTEAVGLYRIHLAGKCLDADNSFGLNNGDRVQLWECLGPGQTNQYWWLVNIGGGQVEIVNNARDKCLTIDNSRLLAPGSPAVIWDCFQTLGQQMMPQAVS
jgi:hypothetical protein